jgi:hypothetical protein
VLGVALVSPASAREPLQDVNVEFLSLKVNATGEALFTYRRSDGRMRHVLAWGETSWELHVAHFSGELPKLEVFPTYGGRWQGLFGRYTYLGRPIFGFGAPAKGVPKDKYGRNVYIDTLNSPYGPGWRRESGILTHLGTGTFCHSFVPQRPFAGYPSQDVRPAAAGERHRITVGGPGVMPVMQVELPGLTKADLERDGEFDAMFAQVMNGDRTCAGER